MLISPDLRVTDPQTDLCIHVQLVFFFSFTPLSEMFVQVSAVLKGLHAPPESHWSSSFYSRLEDPAEFWIRRGPVETFLFGVCVFGRASANLKKVKLKKMLYCTFLQRVTAAAFGPHVYCTLWYLYWKKVKYISRVEIWILCKLIWIFFPVIKSNKKETWSCVSSRAHNKKNVNETGEAR